MPRRLLQLYLGLVAYGVSMVMMLQARLGLMPWDVLHQGIALHSGWSMGRITIAVGVLVLLAWIPIRQRPGLGTISNVIVVGLVFDAAMWLVGDALAGTGLAARWALLVGGVALNALATAAYIGARLGPGPRDGLMTGLARRTGWSLRLVRTGIEGSVLLAGFALGGAVGVGTVLYALAIGPLVQRAVPLFDRSVALPTPGAAAR
jgi:uncharacterized membrane protein YczE